MNKKLDEYMIHRNNMHFKEGYKAGRKEAANAFSVLIVLLVILVIVFCGFLTGPIC